MVAFFIPNASNAEQAEGVYQATRQNVEGLEAQPRIRALRWWHDGQMRNAEVGSPMPTYYAPTGDTVIAIFDAGPFYKVCSENRGVFRGDGVMAGKDLRTQVSFFDQS